MIAFEPEICLMCMNCTRRTALRFRGIAACPVHWVEAAGILGHDRIAAENLNKKAAGRTEVPTKTGRYET